MKRRTKFVIVGGLVLVVGGVAAAGMSMGENGTQVRMETVASRDLVSTVSASGWIRPRRKVDVQADIMGRIVELPVEEGQQVRTGQLLLRIDPTQYEAAVAQARAGVSGAQAQEAQTRAGLLQAQRTYERAKTMSSAGANLVSQQSLEDAETQMRVQTAMLESARYGVERARAMLSEAQDRLSKTVIRAPIDGVVTRLKVELGEMAIVGTMNNPGSLLMTISDLSVMEAVIRVDETDVPELMLGDSATIEIDAFPNQRFAGRVTQIGHSSVNSPGTAMSGMGGGGTQAIDFEVVVTLDSPPPTLRPDLSANAEIVTDTRKGALSIPIIALTVREKEPKTEDVAGSKQFPAAPVDAVNPKDKDEEGVYVVRGGKAKFVPVKVGIAGQEYFEVVNGLTAKDTVVAGPYEAIRGLSDDQPVREMPKEKDQKKGKAAKKEGA